MKELVSMKGLLLLAGAGWTTYLVVSNINRDKKIKQLQAAVADQKATLDQIAADKQFTIPPGYIDEPIFPDKIKKQFKNRNGALQPLPAVFV